MKLKRCTRTCNWDYCTDCNGGGIIVEWSAADERLPVEKQLEKYNRALARMEAIDKGAV